jgi:hypothetical protein
MKKTIYLFLLLISGNSLAVDTKKDLMMRPVFAKIQSPSEDDLIDRIQTDDIVKDFKNMMENEGRKFPVVNHQLIYFSSSKNHVRKCIAEESEGTVGVYEGQFGVQVRIHPSGLIKNVEFINTKEMSIYLKACFISGISRVIFPQPLDGNETVITQQFYLKLRPEAQTEEARLTLSFHEKVLAESRE